MSTVMVVKTNFKQQTIRVTISNNDYQSSDNNHITNNNDNNMTT